MKKYIYMYGQVMSTHSFLLSGNFPKPDGEADIKEKYHVIGGETGTASAVLTSLGLFVKLGGTHLGIFPNLSVKTLTALLTML